MSACFYCGKPMRKRPSVPVGVVQGPFLPQDQTVDHLTPFSRGGADRAENRVACCISCNWDKGSMTLGEYRVVVAMRFRLDSQSFKFPGEVKDAVQSASTCVSNALPDRSRDVGYAEALSAPVSGARVEER